MSEKHAKTVYLGLSLTTILMHPSKDDLILDLWEGGSTLYGWDVMGSCLDRVPIFVNESNCINLLGGEPEELDVNTRLEGSELDYIAKVTKEGVDPSMFKLSRLGSKTWFPRGGWCRLFRNLAKQTQATKLFGELRWLNPESRELGFGWWGTIKYDKLIITMPLDYVISKLRSEKIANLNNNFSYLSFFITVAVFRGKRDSVEVVFLGKNRYASAVVVTMPLLYKGGIFSSADYFLAYSFILYHKHYMRGGLRQKALSDFKRLGLDVASIIAERGYFEKYGILGTKPETKEFSWRSNIALAGRLGTWVEKGICDIMRELSS